MASSESTLIPDNAQALSRSTDGRIPDNILQATGSLDAGKERTELRLPGGSVIHLPTALLMHATRKAEITASEFSASPYETVIPIVEERLKIDKSIVETGRVTLEKRVHEYQETLDVPLAARSFEIERVVLNQPVDKAPVVRHEGLTTIYPLVEEQLIITTQLILKEELRITQRDTERRDTRTVTLKREAIDVIRTPLT